MKNLAATFAIALLALTTSLKADTLRTFTLQASDTYTDLSGLVVIDTTTGQALYGYADLTLTPLGDLSRHPPLPAPIVLSGGGVLTNGGCLNDCMDYPDEHSFRFSTADPNGDGNFSLLMTAPNNLVDYMGGKLCYFPGSCEGDAYTYAVYTVNYPSILFNGVQYPGGAYTDIANYFNANLTYVSQVSTPEPSSFVLLSSGTLGLLGVFRRKLFNC
jgi:hypothetical protein